MADELFGQSTAQLSFDKFINTINKDQAKDLVKSINIFMKKFIKRPASSESDSREVQAFLADMEGQFARHPLWAGCAQEELDAAVEGLEKYLMTKLHDRTFGQDIIDRERDASLSRRLSALQFVRPEHLEVSSDFEGDSSLMLAQKELKKLNAFKCPREKLVCMLNCCKVINNLLSSRKYGAGADDFTPVLIYATIKAQPEQLASNLAFVERYRLSSRLVAEAAYFFVQMQGAASFIETMTTASLKVDPDEFIAHMLDAGAMSDVELSMMLQQQQQQQEEARQKEQVKQQQQQQQQQLHQQQQQQLQNQHVPTGSVSGAAAPPPPPALRAAPAPQSSPPAALWASAADANGQSSSPAPSSQPQQQQHQYAGGTNVGSAQLLPPPPPPQAAAAAAQYSMAPPPPPPAAASSSPRWSAEQRRRPEAPPPRSVAELEAEGVGLLLRAETAGELQARYRFLYASADSLNMREVRALLAQYKELVLRHEMLVQAVEHQVLKYYSDLEQYEVQSSEQAAPAHHFNPPPPAVTSSPPTAQGAAAHNPHGMYAPANTRQQYSAGPDTPQQYTGGMQQQQQPQQQQRQYSGTALPDGPHAYPASYPAQQYTTAPLPPFLIQQQGSFSNQQQQQHGSFSAGQQPPHAFGQQQQQQPSMSSAQQQQQWSFDELPPSHVMSNPSQYPSVNPDANHPSSAGYSSHHGASSSQSVNHDLEHGGGNGGGGGGGGMMGFVNSTAMGVMEFMNPMQMLHLSSPQQPPSPPSAEQQPWPPLPSYRSGSVSDDMDAFDFSLLSRRNMQPAPPSTKPGASGDGAGGPALQSEAPSPPPAQVVNLATGASSSQQQPQHQQDTEATFAMPPATMPEATMEEQEDAILQAAIKQSLEEAEALHATSAYGGAADMAGVAAIAGVADVAGAAGMPHTADTACAAGMADAADTAGAAGSAAGDDAWAGQRAVGAYAAAPAPTAAGSSTVGTHAAAPPSPADAAPSGSHPGQRPSSAGGGSGDGQPSAAHAHCALGDDQDGAQAAADVAPADSSPHVPDPPALAMEGTGVEAAGPSDQDAAVGAVAVGAEAMAPTVQEETGSGVVHQPGAVGVEGSDGGMEQQPPKSDVTEPDSFAAPPAPLASAHGADAEAGRVDEQFPSEGPTGDETPGEELPGDATASGIVAGALLSGAGAAGKEGGAGSANEGTANADDVEGGDAAATVAREDDGDAAYVGKGVSPADVAEAVDPAAVAPSTSEGRDDSSPPDVEQQPDGAGHPPASSDDSDALRSHAAVVDKEPDAAVPADVSRSVASRPPAAVQQTSVSQPPAAAPHPIVSHPPALSQEDSNVDALMNDLLGSDEDEEQ